MSDLIEPVKTIKVRPAVLEAFERIRDGGYVGKTMELAEIKRARDGGIIKRNYKAVFHGCSDRIWSDVSALRNHDLIEYDESGEGLEGWAYMLAPYSFRVTSCGGRAAINKKESTITFEVADEQAIAKAV